jgi:enterochelin esterase family protein
MREGWSAIMPMLPAAGGIPGAPLRLALLLALLSVSGRAQTSPPAPVVSPEILSDRCVVFRLRAPNAKSVLLSREGGKPVPMKMDGQGVWTVTTDPLEPDIYAYSFLVDGVGIIDPMNAQVRPNLLNLLSVVHVPGASPLPWEPQPVPKGVVHKHTYTSRVADDERDFYVYTPPGYDGRAAKRYPVLYLQHGYSGDAQGWLTGAPANVILDNLIAAGKATPMLLVMSLGYGVPGIARREGPKPAELKQNYNRFREALLSEVIPQVEKSYRVAAGRDSRAIAGVSMGGAEALYTGLNAPDEFAWVGSFSAGGMPEDFSADFPALNAGAATKLRLLWIACSTDDPLIASNRKFREWLTSKGVVFTPIETPGVHSWLVWRRNFLAFVPLLFR